MESVGDKKTFAASGMNSGITYREWLIGQALPGSIKAKTAIDIADQVIALLDKEIEDDREKSEKSVT